MSLCTSLSSTTLTELREDYARARSAGSDLVELRLDYLQADQLEHLNELESWFAEHAVHLIVTFRPQDEGGHYAGDVQERLNALMWCAGFSPRWVDFEYNRYVQSPQIAEKLRLMGAPAERDRLARILLSVHHSETPVKLISEFLELCRSPAETVKMVWPARDARDNFEALDMQKCADRPATVFCSGMAGLPSRILGRKAGAAITYCALDKGAETAPGQATLTDMLSGYRFKDINNDTQVYGVIGDPIAHSLSPAVHNAAFAHENINAVYLPFALGGDGHTFAEFVKGVAERAWLNVRGFSVTSPHKRNAWILTQDDLDPVTMRLEAINTLSFTRDNVRGDNTDYQGAIGWLQAGLGCELPGFADMKIDVLGAGGLARSIVAALRLLRAQVTVYNRTQEKAQRLADAFNCRAEILDSSTVLDADVIINCTTVGMFPNVYQSPVKPQSIQSGRTVFDAVYNPRQTQLLKDAAERQCKTIDGLELFIRQAGLQFTVWTTRVAPIDIMRQVAAQHLQQIT